MTLSNLAFWKKSANAEKPVKVNNGGGKAKRFFSQLSGAFMLPISVMAVAGLFLGVGAAIASHTSGGASTFGTFIKNIGDPVFNAMPILFMVAMVIAFTDDIGTAVFAGLVSFLVFNAIQTPFIQSEGDGSTGTATFFNIHISNEFSEMAYKSVGSVAGITALNTSIFAGIVVGWVVAKLYNKFHTIQLPSMISFFGGKRFVAFVAIAAVIPLAFIFLLLWPFIAAGLGYFGKYSGKVAGLDSFIFGFIERSLIPFGLHHVFYAPLWYTGAGGDVIQTIKDSNAVITAINGTSITVNGTNMAHAQDSITALLKLKDSLHHIVFANANAISATLPATGNWQAAITTANLSQVITEINNTIANKASGLITGGTENDLVTALLDQRIKSVTTLNEVLYDKMGTHALGDSFGWLAVNGSGVNRVSYFIDANKNGIKDANEAAGTKKIFDFLDNEGGLRLGRFMQGKFSFMQFGLPAAAAAMVFAAPKENRKMALGTIVPAAATSFVTGVTEPIEFTFLFLAPWLFWGFHALMAAFSFLFMNLLHAHVGMTFSGGFLDAIIYGAVPFDQGTNFYWYFVIGVIYAPIYFLVFLFVIKKFDLATPGRGGNTKLFTKADYKASKNDSTAKGALTAQSAKIVAAFGGWDNITSYKNCATRLRYDVKDASKVSTDALKAAGAVGVMPVGATHVQAIMGPQAEQINTNIKNNVGAPLSDQPVVVAAEVASATSVVEPSVVKKPAAKKASVKK